MLEHIYEFESRVRYSEVSVDQKITIPGIVNYFQDCTTFQSEDLGIGLDYLERKKAAWILSAWQIVVERYPRLNERIKVATWAYDFKGLLGLRNFRMRDEKGEVIVCANSYWVYMDVASGRPTRPSQEEIDRYGTAPKLDMTYAPRKIQKPEQFVGGVPIPVRKDQLDTNQHVNNCQYIQMALEAADIQGDCRQIRVEYTDSAVLGDVIYPRVAKEEERIVVELCNTKKTPYATVEIMRDKTERERSQA